MTATKRARRLPSALDPPADAANSARALTATPPVRCSASTRACSYAARGSYRAGRCSARPTTGVGDALRRAWGIDALACPRCDGAMRMIVVIEDAQVARKILRHLPLIVPPAVPWPSACGAPANPLRRAALFRRLTNRYESSRSMLRVYPKRRNGTDQAHARRPRDGRHARSRTSRLQRCAPKMQIVCPMHLVCRIVRRRAASWPTPKAAC